MGEFSDLFDPATNGGRRPNSEYPRPQFRSSEWLNLNGEWAFTFDDKDTSVR
jgi:hypothetical protein